MAQAEHVPVRLSVERIAKKDVHLVYEEHSRAVSLLCKEIRQVGEKLTKLTHVCRSVSLEEFDEHLAAVGEYLARAAHQMTGQIAEIGVENVLFDLWASKQGGMKLYLE
jgi:hypothetical protein